MTPENKSASDNFISTLYPFGFPDNSVMSIWSRGTKNSTHCKREDLLNSVEILSDRGHELYYGVCLRKPGLTPGERGKVGSCVAVPGVWLDIDLHDPTAHASSALPPDLDAACEILSCGPDPTLIVHSGFGLHVYWLLHTTLPLVGGDVNVWHDACKKWQDRYIAHARTKGWHVDQTGNLDRILRLPGTINHKGADPLNPPIVRVVDSSGPRYAPEALLGAPLRSNASTPAAGDLRAVLAGHVAAGWGTDETRARLSDVLAGRPFAPQGARDTTLTAIAGALGYMFPDASPDHIVDLLDASLATFEADDAGRYSQADRRAWAAEKVARAQAAKGDAIAADRARATEFAARVFGYDAPTNPDAPWAPPIPTTPRPRPEATYTGRLATPPPGLPAPGQSTYTPEEMEAYGVQQGASNYNDFRKRWILQVGEFYYVYINGAYRNPVAKSGLEHGIQTDLAPAWPYVETHYRNDDGELKAKTTKTLMQEYGTVVRNTVVELGLPTSIYDAQSDTFRESACPFRRLTARYHAQVDQWLTAMGGPVLLDWVACITRLDKQCAALYLEGPPGTGKSLLGRGLARLWTTSGPTDLINVLGDWSDGLTRCPLLIADEHLPSSFGRKSTSAELRTLIGNSTHNLKRKYHNLTSLAGCVRVILAGNNEDLISFDNEELTSDDMAAVAERFLHIKHDDAPRKYLASPGVSTAGWVDQDVIAEHALWLAENRVVPPGGRFLVKGNFTTTKFVTHGSSTRSRVVEWVARYILSPMTSGGPASKGLVQIGNGFVHLNVEALVNYWEDVVKSDPRTPTTTSLGRALRSISHGQVRARKNNRRRYWQVNTQIVVDWAEANGLDYEAVAERIAAKVVFTADDLPS